MTGRTAAACAGALEPVIRETLEATECLESALADERAALEQRDPHALDDAGTRKQAHLATLEALDGQRRRLLAEHGYPVEGGLEALLAECTAGHPLNGLWQALSASAARCRDANAANGAIVHLRQRQITRALDVLRGVPPQSAPVYGADGSRTRPGGRAFGSA